MQHEPAPRLLSRRRASRGLSVQAQFRDGERLTGRLVGWGPRVIRVSTGDGIAERAVPTLARVIAF